MYYRNIHFASPSFSEKIKDIKTILFCCIYVIFIKVYLSTTVLIVPVWTPAYALMESIATHVIVLQGLVDTTVKKVNLFSYTDTIVYSDKHIHVSIEAIYYFR
jgi:uncharacterized membrane protein YqjE